MFADGTLRARPSLQYTQRVLGVHHAGYAGFNFWQADPRTSHDG